MNVRWMEPEEMGCVRALGWRAFPPFLAALMSISLSPRALVAEDETGRLVGCLSVKTFRGAGQKLGVLEWIFTGPSLDHSSRGGPRRWRSREGGGWRPGPLSRSGQVSLSFELPVNAVSLIVLEAKSANGLC